MTPNRELHRAGRLDPPPWSLDARPAAPKGAVDSGSVRAAPAAGTDTAVTWGATAQKRRAPADPGADRSLHILGLSPSERYR